jgi:hypothetical protein
MIRYGFTSYYSYRDYVDLENVYNISGAKIEYKYNSLLVWDSFYWKRGQDDISKREKRLRRLLKVNSSFNLPIWGCGVKPYAYVWRLCYHRSHFALRLDKKVLHLLFPQNISPVEVETIIGVLYNKIVNPIVIKRMHLKAQWFKN